MNILIACEESGVVRDAFTAMGHNAVSCDLKPSRQPGPHYQGDVRDILHYRWDALIAHPVCKRLTNAGAKHLYIGCKKENGINPVMWQAMLDGAAFFNLFRSDLVQHIPKRCVENPIMHCHARALTGGHRATQYVHPWWFGSPFQKATGLHLTGFPKLPREREKSSYPEGGIKQAVWLMGPSEDREEKRSRTDPQVARAMAQYWS